ncbi:MAG: FAD-dependent oxidoreductase [Acidimicrobiales bacterium]|nr:FAD-dependent oxidoreductase [Acidimicrobiales bacterium]
MTGRPISRRAFLRTAGVGAGAASLLKVVPAIAGPAPVASLKTAVAVLGGGVGGLTAAHELAERGFQVTVFEPKALGGKARSIPVAGTGRDGRSDLPGEHGFRFFPGFYKNIPDTMRRIPVAGQQHGVFDALVDAQQELLVFDGSSEQVYLPPTFDQRGFQETIASVITAATIGSQIPPNELEYFIRKMNVFVTSCDARREGQWEHVSWWEFVNAEHFSPKYQRVIGTGLTKDLVAAKGTRASTRTIGLMAEAFVYTAMGQIVPGMQQQTGYGAADRLLNGPTNEVWIDPWVAHLRSLGVQFVTGYGAEKLQMNGGRVSGADLVDPSGARLQVDADWFIAAMPLERARELFDGPVREAAPELAGLDQLEYDYMNGIQFFLNRPQPNGVKGHVAFLESPWALTSILQGLFWQRHLPQQYGDGRVREILSVDISDWFTPGILYGKPAVDCTPAEVAAECWAQMKQGLNTTQDVELTDDMIVSWILDPAVTYLPGQAAVSTEPLMINTPGSLQHRPKAVTSIPNLLLAADYVRVNIDLATMEGANEAGREAANGVLARAGSPAMPATVQKLWDPPQLAPAKQADAALYAAGRPNVFDTVPAGLPV